MSTDFNKGDAKGLSYAGDAEEAYYQHYCRRYPKQIAALEAHIQKVASEGRTTVEICLAIPNSHQEKKHQEDITDFNQFLMRYIVSRGYSAETIAGTRPAWVRSGSERTWEGAGRRAVGYKKTGNPNNFLESFPCKRNEIAFMSGLLISW